MKEIEEENGWEQGKTAWVTTCLVPRPYYSVRPNRFSSRGPRFFPPIRLRYVIEVRVWEIAVEGQRLWNWDKRGGKWKILGRQGCGT